MMRPAAGCGRPGSGSAAPAPAVHLQASASARRFSAVASGPFFPNISSTAPASSSSGRPSRVPATPSAATLACRLGGELGEGDAQAGDAEGVEPLVGDQQPAGSKLGAVQADRLLVERDQQVDRLRRRADLTLAEADRPGVVPAAHARVIPLRDADAPAGAHEGLREELADSDQPLSGLAADQDRPRRKQCRQSRSSGNPPCPPLSKGGEGGLCRSRCSRPILPPFGKGGRGVCPAPTSSRRGPRSTRAGARRPGTGPAPRPPRGRNRSCGRPTSRACRA